MPSNYPFDQRLRDVFSLRSAIPVLNEYLSTIQVDEEHPGFLFDWQVDNVTAFVAAANSLDPAQAPQWLRTRPPLMTCSSFTDDVIAVLEPLAGGRCGHVMLAPNTTGQFGGICLMMGALQNSAFLQDAAQLALPVANDVEKHLVETHYLVESKAQPNHLPPALRDGQHPMRRVSSNALRAVFCHLLFQSFIGRFIIAAGSYNVRCEVLHNKNSEKVL